MLSAVSQPHAALQNMLDGVSLDVITACMNLANSFRYLYDVHGLDLVCSLPHLAQPTNQHHGLGLHPCQRHCGAAAQPDAHKHQRHNGGRGGSVREELAVYHRSWVFARPCLSPAQAAAVASYCGQNTQADLRWRGLPMCVEHALCPQNHGVKLLSGHPSRQRPILCACHTDMLLTLQRGHTALSNRKLGCRYHASRHRSTCTTSRAKEVSRSPVIDRHPWISRGLVTNSTRRRCCCPVHVAALSSRDRTRPRCIS